MIKTRQIHVGIREAEQKHDCRILFAAESGSRAWGFASPDSDYDVRFIYVKPPTWYLQLEERRDTIEWFEDDGLYDYSGWDLRKTLRLFAACNPTLNEQIQSPMVYTANEAFHRAMLDLIPVYFQPKKAMFHYLGIASHSKETVATQRKMEIKKLFYVLRPLLACLWIAERKTMPPTEFSRLFECVALDSDIRSELDRLLIQKQSAKEKELAEIVTELAIWAKQTFEHCDGLAKTFSATEKPGWEPLNDLFLGFGGFKNL